MRCPNCNDKNLGKIGNHVYYCWNCYIELTVSGNQLSLNQIEEDGSLTSLDDLFCDDEKTVM